MPRADWKIVTRLLNGLISLTFHVQLDKPASLPQHGVVIIGSIVSKNPSQTTEVKWLIVAAHIGISRDCVSHRGGPRAIRTPWVSSVSSVHRVSSMHFDLGVSFIGWVQADPQQQGIARNSKSLQNSDFSFTDLLESKG